MLRVEVVNRLRGDGGEALLTKKGMQVRSPKRTTRGEARVLPRTNNVSELAEPGVFPSLFKHSLQAGGIEVLDVRWAEESDLKLLEAARRVIAVATKMIVDELLNDHGDHGADHATT